MTNPASDTVRIKAGPYAFTAQLLVDQAPKTCEAFRKLLPLRNKIIQTRWSGESAWIPLGDARQLTELENHTCYPSRGDILWYPGGISESEILVAYGALVREQDGTACRQSLSDHCGRTRESGRPR